MKSASRPAPGARTAESARFSNAVNPSSSCKRWVREDMAVRAPKRLNGLRQAQGTSCAGRAAHSPAFTIIECLVYIGLFAVLLGLGTVAFYRCFDNMKGLRRNADDITRAVHAGELWRNDIRAAARAIQVDETDQTIRIPQRDREVFYRFADTQVFRKTGADAPWLPLLPKVKSSQMTSDPRAHVTAWRWELELQISRKDTRVRPLFTFLAVPDFGNPP